MGAAAKVVQAGIKAYLMSKKRAGSYAIDNEMHLMTLSQTLSEMHSSSVNFGSTTRGSEGSWSRRTCRTSLTKCSIAALLDERIKKKEAEGHGLKKKAGIISGLAEEMREWMAGVQTIALSLCCTKQHLQELEVEVAHGEFFTAVADGVSLCQMLGALVPHKG